MEEKILRLFLIKSRLKFSEIEKSLKVRSNKVDYHIKKLLNKRIIEKEKEFYKLTEASEHLIPYLSDKNSVLPVILISIGDKDKVFLYKREKRPYKDFLSLPGGRLILGESISESVKRIMKEKHNINSELKQINTVSLEQVYQNNKIIHSFLLIFVTAKTQDKIDLIDLNKNKSEIIPSDYNLIKKDSNKTTSIKTIKSGIYKNKQKV